MPWLQLTPMVMAKTSVSIALMAVGMYYLVTGRKQADLGRILTGAVLTLASIVLF